VSVRDRNPVRARWLARIAVACGLCVAHPVHAQNRGVYPLGMTALNAGVLPGAGVTYSNQFLVYARDRAKDNDGNTEPVGGAHSVRMDMNTFTWVSSWSIEGFRYAAAATLPVAWNSLTSDLHGPVSSGRGFADSYYLPVIVGRSGDRVAIRAQYGFLAPTGNFTAEGTNNVGSGYWTHTLSTGETLGLTADPRLTLSAFELYEIHTEQRGTNIRPGDSFNLDASLMWQVHRDDIARVELGAVGYLQRQTTARSGSGVPAESLGDRYAVHALGAALSVAFSKRRANLGLKYFSELANRSTFEGYSLQLVAGIAL
jgi:hypothetical protein